MISKDTKNIKVAVRCRPLLNYEIQNQRTTIIATTPARDKIIVRNPKIGVNDQREVFTFDSVYDWNCSQEQVYNETAYSIVESVFKGYNGTIFTYGQPATGKTFTMEGNLNESSLHGIIPRTFEHIFKSIQENTNKQFLVTCSFLDLYKEEIRDLLSTNPKNKLDLRENKAEIYVKDLTTHTVQSAQEMFDKLFQGRKRKAEDFPNLNLVSTCSHSIFTIIVETSEFSDDGGGHICRGKLNLVDLAGPQVTAHAQGDNFDMIRSTNNALSSLSNVISALVDKKEHIPYRASKLTRILQDSLGGNTKTLMIAHISPADCYFEETIRTLKYASRFRSIKNKPKINDKDIVLREYQDEHMNVKSHTTSLQVGETADLSNLLANESFEVIFERKRAKLLEAFKQKEESEAKTKEGHQNLLKKLKSMEENVLVGTKAIKELQNTRLALEEKIQRDPNDQLEDKKL